jgi:two-component system response regulator AdeR
MHERARVPVNTDDEPMSDGPLAVSFGPRPKVLIVEDEEQIAGILALYLKGGGFETRTSKGVIDALRMHREWRPDLMLLDIGLPDGDGRDVLKAIREQSDVGIILATAVDDDASRLSCLRDGADDYVVKPYKWLEVVERVRAVIRRTRGAEPSHIIQVGPIQIDIEARIVTVENAGDSGHSGVVRLTPTEFDLLAHMARYPTRAFSRTGLLEAVGAERDVFDRIIDSHLSKARAKLAIFGLSNFIQPVRGVGYRLWPVT